MISNTIDLYYFTGTGNTLLVARRMVEVFEQNGRIVNLHRIENSDPSAVDLSHVIGLAFPVAAQSTFPLVWDFARTLPDADGTKIFMVDTVSIFSGAIVGPLKRVLVKKGYRPIGAKEITMPGNWFPGKVNKDRNQRTVARGLERASVYAGRLVDGTSHWLRVPVLSDAFYWLNSRPIVWRKLAEIGEKYRVDREACNGCGYCEKLCPVGNIGYDEYPSFGPACQQCMRCIAFCPREAISVPGKKYELYRAVKIKDLLGEWQND